MTHQDDAWWRHPRMRLRHDAHLWIRPDIARWMRGVDPADVFPSLARDRAQAEAARQRARAAEDAELDAFIEHERRVLAALRAEQNEVNAELARRRMPAEAKYSPSQPRVPAGNPRGGQWSDGSGGEGTVAGPNRDTRPSTGASLAQPMGMSNSAMSAGPANSAICFTSSRTACARMPGTLPS
jgi:type II secretory pathway pseudopilin PulG